MSFALLCGHAFAAPAVESASATRLAAFGREDVPAATHISVTAAPSEPTALGVSQLEVAASSPFWPWSNNTDIKAPVLVHGPNGTVAVHLNSTSRVAHQDINSTNHDSPAPLSAEKEKLLKKYYNIYSKYHLAVATRERFTRYLAYTKAAIKDEEAHLHYALEVWDNNLWSMQKFCDGKQVCILPYQTRINEMRVTAQDTEKGLEKLDHYQKQLEKKVAKAEKQVERASEKLTPLYAEFYKQNWNVTVPVHHGPTITILTLTPTPTPTLHSAAGYAAPTTESAAGYAATSTESAAGYTAPTYHPIAKREDIDGPIDGDDDFHIDSDLMTLKNLEGRLRAIEAYLAQLERQEEQSAKEIDYLGAAYTHTANKLPDLYINRLDLAKELLENLDGDTHDLEEESDRTGEALEQAWGTIDDLWKSIGETMPETMKTKMNISKHEAIKTEVEAAIEEAQDKTDATATATTAAPSDDATPTAPAHLCNAPNDCPEPYRPDALHEG